MSWVRLHPHPGRQDDETPVRISVVSGRTVFSLAPGLCASIGLRLRDFVNVDFGTDGDAGFLTLSRAETQEFRLVTSNRTSKRLRLALHLDGQPKKLRSTKVRYQIKDGGALVVALPWCDPDLVRGNDGDAIPGTVTRSLANAPSEAADRTAQSFPGGGGRAASLPRAPSSEGGAPAETGRTGGNAPPTNPEPAKAADPEAKPARAVRAAVPSGEAKAGRRAPAAAHRPGPEASYGANADRDAAGAGGSPAPLPTGALRRPTRAQLMAGR